MTIKTQIPRPILRWPGGKTRMLKKILPRIPAHVCYCEPFVGGGAVLFAKPRSQVEVVNDFNGDLVALYLNAQRHLPELLRQVESFVSSRKIFHLFTAQPGLTEIERAARFLLRNRVSFGGNMHSFGVAKTRGGGVGFDRKGVTQLIRNAHQRLDKVVIENLPYERCFDNYDSKDTFFFIDPPYLNAKIQAYSDWNEEQMRGFKRNIEKLKGQWIVTVDASDFNRNLFADCRIETVSTSNGCVNKRVAGDQTFGELIITPP